MASTASGRRSAPVTHPKKKVDGGLDQKVQRARIHSRTHQVGLSEVKSLNFMVAGWSTLATFRPHRRVLERLVGKLGFAHGFRPAFRRSFGTTHLFLQDAHEGAVGRLPWGAPEWWEMMEACCLLPLAQVKLSAEWSPVVHCSDACLAGHGIAYAYVGVAEARRWSRFCSLRGDSTILSEVQDSRPEDDRCPLVVAKLPLAAYHWYEVARPGGFLNIAEEEVMAANWALERRIVGRKGVDMRCLEGGDNTIAVERQEQLQENPPPLPEAHGVGCRSKSDRLQVLPPERVQSNGSAEPSTMLAGRRPGRDVAAIVFGGQTRVWQVGPARPR